MASNLVSSPLRRGAADFRRYAEFLPCIWANDTNGKQSGFAPSTERRRRLSPSRGVPVLHMGKWDWLRPLYVEAPQTFAATQNYCLAFLQMAAMASDLASSPLRRGAADVRRYVEFLSCIWAHGTNGKRSGFVPSTERRRRLSPLRRVPVLHIGKWHQWQAIWLRPLYGEAPQTFAVTQSSCRAYGQMALMASNLASSPLR